MITASLIIFHNSSEEISNITQCIIASSIDKLYVIDQSDNDYYRKLQKLSHKISYIHNKNIGYGAGHNLAINIAINDDNSVYHIVLNPDIYFNNGCIEQLTKYMNTNEDVGLVMPKVFYPNGEIQYLCKLIPSPIDIIFRRFLPYNIIRYRDEKFKLVFTQYNKEMNVPYLSGCFMFFRTSALEKVGLFDQRYFMHFEDLDISRRMHSHFKTIFYPNVSIIHAHAASHRHSMKMLLISLQSAIKYFNKWGWIFDKERIKINKTTIQQFTIK